MRGINLKIDDIWVLDLFMTGHKAKSGFCSKNMKIFRYLFTLLEDDPEARKILLGWVRP